MPNPNHPPLTARIKVNVHSVNPVSFTFESQDLTVGANNHLTFRNTKGNSGYEIYYELSGADGYRFPADMSEALYVKGGSKTDCPGEPSKWGQFKAIEAQSSTSDADGERRVLKVENKNDAHADFAYTLRAFNASGDKLLLDPGGTNENGGGDNPMMASNSNVLIGLAVVALIGVAYLALR